MVTCLGFLLFCAPAWTVGRKRSVLAWKRLLPPSRWVLASPGPCSPPSSALPLRPGADAPPQARPSQGLCDTSRVAHRVEWSQHFTKGPSSRRRWDGFCRVGWGTTRRRQPAVGAQRRAQRMRVFHLTLCTAFVREPGWRPGCLSEMSAVGVLCRLCPLCSAGRVQWRSWL